MAHAQRETLSSVEPFLGRPLLRNQVQVLVLFSPPGCPATRMHTSDARSPQSCCCRRLPQTQQCHHVCSAGDFMGRHAPSTHKFSEREYKSETAEGTKGEQPVEGMKDVLSTGFHPTHQTSSQAARRESDGSFIHSRAQGKLALPRSRVWMLQRAASWERLHKHQYSKPQPFPEEQYPHPTQLSREPQVQMGDA